VINDSVLTGGECIKGRRIKKRNTPKREAERKEQKEPHVRKNYLGGNKEVNPWTSCRMPKEVLFHEHGRGKRDWKNLQSGRGRIARNQNNGCREKTLGQVCLHKRGKFFGNNQILWELSSLEEGVGRREV